MTPFLSGADGHERSECEPDRAKQGRVVRSSHRLSEVEPTPLPCFALSGSHSLRSCPSAPAKEASRHFLKCAQPPLLVQGGDFGFPSSCLQCPRVQQKDVGHGKAVMQGGESRFDSKSFTPSIDR